MAISKSPKVYFDWESKANVRGNGVPLEYIDAGDFWKHYGKVIPEIYKTAYWSSGFFWLTKRIAGEGEKLHEDINDCMMPPIVSDCLRNPVAGALPRSKHPRLGEFYRDVSGDVYIITRNRHRQLVAVCLESGNRWSDHDCFDGDDDMFEIIDGYEIKVNNG